MNRGRPPDTSPDLRKRIVALQLESGLGALGVAAILERSGVAAPRGGWHWHPSTVTRVLNDAGIVLRRGRQPVWLPGWNANDVDATPLHGVTAIASRRRQPGSGSDLSALLMEDRPIEDEWLMLDRAFGVVPHAVIGAIACNQHMPPRHTMDIDFAVAVERAGEAVAALERAGWRLVRTLALRPPLQGWAWRDEDGRPADVIAVPGAFGEALVASAQCNLGWGLPLATLSHLVTLKLLAGRAQDGADITRMLGHQDELTIQSVRAVVRKVLGDAEIEDLDQLIELGRLEYRGGC
jgi:hypothetical protein